jgi:outer membrane protein assembly factor BamB
MMTFTKMPRMLYPLFAVAFFAVAAAPTCAVHEWTLPFDAARVIDQKVDPAGNVYALLSSAPHGVELQKFDTSGRLLWTSPVLDEYAEARLDFDAAGDAYVLIMPSWPDTESVVTVKYDPFGRLLWRARFTPDPPWHADYPVLAVDRATGVAYVTASTQTFPTEEGALAIIKYAADGHQEWMRSYRPDAVSVGQASDDTVVVTPDGGLAALARLSLPDVDVLLRYDAQGNLLWTQSEPMNVMGGVMEQIAVGVDSAIYVGGQNGVSKYAPTGELLWIAPCRVSHVQVDGAGNVYCTEGAITRKYGPSGEQLWSAQYVPPDGLRAGASALALDASGSAYVTMLLREEPVGWSYRTVALVTVKYDADGTQQWLAIHDPPPVESSPPIEDVTVDAQGRVYVLAGGIVIKYAQVEYGQPGG